jgi:hypothetical protein
MKNIKFFLLVLMLVILFISTTKIFKKEIETEKNTYASLKNHEQRIEEKAVIKVIDDLFDAMRAGDSILLKRVFYINANLSTVMEKDGKAEIRNEDLKTFIKAVGAPHNQVYDERITSYEVKIDGKLATVWTDYNFYLGDKFSHCGVNAFQLVKTEEEWKIFQISDTRRKDNCKTETN